MAVCISGVEFESVAVCESVCESVVCMSARCLLCLCPGVCCLSG